MTEMTACDVCREVMCASEMRVTYRVERHDQCGYYDTLDVCSAECLATLAVGEGHQRGERDARATVVPQPATRKRWWQR